MLTPPQREIAAATVLHEAGFAVFVLVKRQMEFENGAARGRMRKIERQRPLMPGYVFTGMSSGTPGWGRMFSFRLVRGVVGWNDRPHEIRHDQVRDLMWRQQGGEFDAPDYQQWIANTQRAWSIGDDVLAFDGSLRGRVVGVEGMEAILEADVLGGLRRIRARVTKLEKADD